MKALGDPEVAATVFAARARLPATVRGAEFKVHVARAARSMKVQNDARDNCGGVAHSIGPCVCLTTHQVPARHPRENGCVSTKRIWSGRGAKQRERSTSFSRGRRMSDSDDARTLFAVEKARKAHCSKVQETWEGGGGREGRKGKASEGVMSQTVPILGCVKERRWLGLHLQCKWSLRPNSKTIEQAAHPCE